MSILCPSWIRIPKKFISNRPFRSGNTTLDYMIQQEAVIVMRVAFCISAFSDFGENKRQASLLASTRLPSNFATN